MFPAFKVDFLEILKKFALLDSAHLRKNKDSTIDFFFMELLKVLNQPHKINIKIYITMFDYKNHALK